MRKFISVLLALMMVLSLTTVAFSAYNVVDDGILTASEAVADEDETARVYFQMPNGHTGNTADSDVTVKRDIVDPETGDVLDTVYDPVIPAGSQALSWYNEYNELDGQNYAGIYWWEADGPNPSAWPGYRMEVEDAEESIFYADIPIYTVNLIFNNGVDGGMDDTNPIYFEAAQTVDINGEGAGPDELDTLPEGAPRPDDWTFDGCIYVVDANQVKINDYSGKQTCGGNWYIYYGDGCYGSYNFDSDNFVSIEENCLNPDHHHGEEETPTEAPATEAPATEAPATEAPATEAPATEAPATEAPATEAEATEAPADTITVKFTDALGWGDINAYYWPSDGLEWPGTPATFVETNEFGQNVYSAEIPANVNGLIFNGNGTQTVDITEDIADGAWWYSIDEQQGTAYKVKLVGAEDQPTEADVTEGEETAAAYYLIGNLTDWAFSTAYPFTEVEEGLYEIENITLSSTDLIKAVSVNKKGTGIGSWYPDGMDNNTTVDAAGIYNIYFRPAGDGTAEDGYAYIPFEGDETGLETHGATRGGYMFKVELVEAIDEPTEDPDAPTEAEEPVETITVKFTDALGWNDINVYYWPASNLSWPGTPATFVETNEYGQNVYSAEVPANAEGIIFNGNGTQTVDITDDIADGAWWYSIDEQEGTNYKVKLVTPVEPVTEEWPTEAPVTEAPATEAEATEAPADTITVKFTDALGWGDINAYYWPSDGLEWPGTPATFVETNEFGQNVYSAEIPANVNGLIFNGNGTQTVDITEDIADGAWWYSIDEQQGTAYKVKLVGAEDQPTEAEPTEGEDTAAEYYLIGNLTDWAFSTEYPFAEVSEGLYEIENVTLSTSDMIKAVSVNKKGTGIGTWYPDGMDNNTTVDVDGIYNIYFRPAGDGTEEDGFAYIPFDGDGTGLETHGATRGGYMFKVELVEEVEVPTEPEQPTEDEPVETITVKFTDALGWNDVNVYYWNNGPQWPGTPATYVETNEYGQNVYSAEVPANVAGIIFNGNGNQTVDITEGIDDGAWWYTVNEQDGTAYKVEKVQPDTEAYLLGDVDGNETVDITDATILQRVDAGMKVSVSDAQIMHGDVDGDGEITIIDVTLIQRYDAGMTVKFPIGEWVNP